jgi:uncharacterized membrane protein
MLIYISVEKASKSTIVGFIILYIVLSLEKIYS